MHLRTAQSSKTVLLKLKDDFTKVEQEYLNDKKNALTQYHIHTLKIKKNKIDKENLKIKNTILFFKKKEEKSKLNIDSFKKMLIQLKKQKESKFLKKKMKLKHIQKLEDSIKNKNKLINIYRKNAKNKKKKLSELKNKRNKIINRDSKIIKKIAKEVKVSILEKRIKKTKSVKHSKSLSRVITNIHDLINSSRIIDRFKITYKFEKFKIEENEKLNKSLKKQKSDIINELKKIKNTESLLYNKLNELVKNK